MCGIVGVFGPAADRQQALRLMLKTVTSRGEVDETLAGEGYGVGTRRLKIVDRERAIQPIFNEDQSKLIIFNGQIFNFRTLKRDLEASHTFTTESDTETILHAYEEYGDQCVHRFDGQFAFVVFDLENETLFAARDHLGIVPLYFVRADGTLYVASVVKALTFLNRKITAVPPGHILDLHGNLTPYYRPAYGGTHLTQAEFVGELKRALRAAVAKRVDTDLPVGVIFSGGIDSTVVLSEASKRHENVTAFTVGTRHSEDLEISQRFCRERNIRQIVIPLKLEDVRLGSIKRAIEVTELNEYLDIINAVISLPLFESIHQAGIKVVLGGDGSDELFGGYDMYRHIRARDAARLFMHNLLTLHRTELQRVDRCSMAFEVEVRVPFLDLNVVELALQMPMEWKIRDGVEKWAVREAFRDELPDYVIERRKNPLSYSSGLHEAVRMYKILFATYYNRCRFDLHEPIKMDFSYVLTSNNYDFDAAVEQDRLARDYPKLELVKEALKAGVRRYVIGPR